MKCRLAIVIPAYKEDFLKEAIDSVARQSCQDFRLYVGDDTGSGKLKRITESYSGNLKIIYKKFEENLGLVDLVSQWARCIDLTNNEEYIWLFSDDDIMPADSVERFYDILGRQTKYDLYRFNIVQIDKYGNHISDTTKHPGAESSESFLIRRLKGETLSAACEYIFSRDIYKRSGGFINFPIAWCTDDASWYRFGKENGIRTITGDSVLWRISERNLSRSGWEKSRKYRATLLFYSWMKSENLSDEVLDLIPFSMRRQINILNISYVVFIASFFTLKRLISFREVLRISFLILRKRIHC